jgi:serine/threonine-protein kinase
MGEDVDERSDVYSLGIVLYEMLVGDVPFQAETQVGVAMKHVNEPLPDVLVARPDVSAAVASVIDRSTTKDPRDRYNSVGEMVRDLEATLEVEAARGGGTTGEATTVLDSVPRSRRRLSGGRRISGAGVAMGLLGIGLIVAALVFGGDSLDRLGGDDKGGAGAEVQIVSATDFDPQGTSGEHPEETELAIDSNPTGTAWSTESYTGGIFDKDGVGIYVETARAVEASAVELRLGQAGSDVEIYTAPGATEAPAAIEDWTLIGSGTDLGTSARIELDSHTPSSFYLVWLTKLPIEEGGSDALQEVSDVRLVGSPEG